MKIKPAKSNDVECCELIESQDVEIQDNVRETEIVKLFDLKKTNHNRIGIDAILNIDVGSFDFEIKSSTMDCISTASPLHIAHIEKWKTRHWIIGIYNKSAKLQYCVYASPEDMAPILKFWEQDIKRGIKISDMLVDKIDETMVWAVFGKKNHYSIEEAKFVFKNLYTKKQYKLFADPKGRINLKNMTEMFKHHNKTYLYRGSALNNPKIQKKVWSKWRVIKKDHAKELRKILREAYGK